LNNLFLGRQVWLSEISVSDHVQYSEWGLVLLANRHFHESSSDWFKNNCEHIWAILWVNVF